MGQSLTTAKMAVCQWVKPVLVGQFEFVEWTPAIISGMRNSSASAKTRTRGAWRESEHRRCRTCSRS